jgi:uncharacterized protein (DUF983 family)
MDYVNLLDGAVVIKIMAIGFVTIVLMAVIEVTYRVEMMGEDDE